MKLLYLTILVVFCAALVQSQLSPDEEDQAFNNYLNKHGIKFSSSEDIKGYKRTFVERYNHVEAHNKDGSATYKLAMDQYSHLPFAEFVKQRTGFIAPSGDSPGEISADVRREGRSLPASFSWLNTANVVRPVQNQGNCGSCWCFAGIAAIEGQMTLRKGLTSKLSEREVIECAYNPWTYKLLGCNGGFDFAVYNHSFVHKGITTEANNPYVANTNAPCNVGTPRTPGSATLGTSPGPLGTSYYLSGNYVLLPGGNEPNMQNYLTTDGPLYASFYVSNDFQMYKGGVYSDAYKLCPGQTSNHAVLIVGYGTDPTGGNYWLAKNSWGVNWGESGYFRIKRGVNLCGIANYVTYPRLA